MNPRKLFFSILFAKIFFEHKPSVFGNISYLFLRSFTISNYLPYQMSLFELRSGYLIWSKFTNQIGLLGCNFAKKMHIRFAWIQLRMQGCRKGGGRGGQLPPRFWRIRWRRRAAAARRITTCPFSFRKLLRPLCNNEQKKVKKNFF